jgi:hypothetical protein
MRARLSTHPYEVAYSQHEGGERTARDDEKLQTDGTHPIVYLAGGSHADYYSAAVWMGRSASEGFGCARHQPAERPGPAGPGPRAHLRRLVLGEGRLGRLHRPLGPEGGRLQQRPDGAIDQGSVAAADRVAGALTARLQRPDSRVALARAERDRLLRRSRRGLERAHLRVEQRPLLAVAIVAGIIAFAGLILTRTRWSPVEIEPIEESRTIGQILRAALRLYRHHRRLFVGIGAVFLPIGAFFTGLEAMLFEDLFGIVGPVR